MAHVTFTSADDTLYAYLVGEIDHDAAQNLRMHIDSALITRCPKTLVLDFSGVGFMDSSGVGLILGRQRCIAALGGQLRIQHATPQMERVLSLARLKLESTSPR
jgi:stage II sporulation protein AA (anti-sigma F factor antagonist)